MQQEHHGRLMHLESRGIDLFYRVEPPRPPPHSPLKHPVILHHGWTSNSSVWTIALPYLVEHFQCITLDARGTGRSDKPTNPSVHTINDYALDVLALLDELKIDKFSFVGHSMGSLVGVEVLRLAGPSRLKHLVLVGPPPIGASSPLTSDPTYFERQRAIFNAAKNGDKEAREILIQRTTTLAGRSLPRDLVERMVDDSSVISDAHYDGSWESMLGVTSSSVNPSDSKSSKNPWHEVLISAASSGTQILFVAGGADSLLGANLKDFQSLRQHAALHVMYRVGHGIPREAAHELAVVLHDFLVNGVVNFVTLLARL